MSDSCAHCSALFVRKGKGHRYCGPPCQKAAWLARNPGHSYRLAASEFFSVPLSKAAKRTVDSEGYVRLVFDNPRGWDAEHRLVLAQKLGRPLRPGESAHHINGQKDDNRPSNLELWVGPMRPGVRAADLTCPHCGVPYAAS